MFLPNIKSSDIKIINSKKKVETIEEKYVNLVRKRTKTPDIQKMSKEEILKLDCSKRLDDYKLCEEMKKMYVSADLKAGS